MKNLMKFSFWMLISSFFLFSLQAQNLSGKKYFIKNTYGGPSHQWYGGTLAWDTGTGSHPMATVEKDDPVAWEFQAVPGKANTYKIISTYPGHWYGASLSWDNGASHPMISVEKDDPVEWRMDAVPGKANTYKIVSTYGGKWQGASISWDISKYHPMASLEFDDPVEWELIPNVALNKSANQSTVYEHGGEASRAVDGNTNGVLSKGSVTHTAKGDQEPYWEVDLGGLYDITAIKIYNRSECCQERLKDTFIAVSENKIGYNNYTAFDLNDPQGKKNPINKLVYGINKDISYNSIAHQKQVRGRYVKIFQKAGGFLSLAEVEVYGTKVNNQRPTSSKSPIFTPNFNSIYTIKSKAAGHKNWDVAGRFSEKGTNVIMYNPNGEDKQRFRFVNAGGGFYYIESLLKEQMVIEIAQGRMTDGSNVQLILKGSGTPAQKFKLLDAGNGYVMMASAMRPDLYLGVSDDFTNLVLREKGASKKSNMLFKLVKEPTPPNFPNFNPDINAVYNIQPKAASHKNWDAAGFVIQAQKTQGNQNLKEGTNVIMYNANEEAKQCFRFVNAGNGFYYIESLLKKQMVIEIANGRVADESNAVLILQNGGNAQKFKLLDAGNGYVMMVSAMRPTLYLGINDGLTNLVLRSGNRGDKLLFKLVEKKTSKPMNVAKGKTTLQSSVYVHGGEGSRAVDGNTNGIYSNRSVTHTAPDDKIPFWEVDLGAQYDISSIKIYNRTECCQERLKDTFIIVTPDRRGSGGQYESYDLNNPIIYAINKDVSANPIVHNKPIRGRYVKIFQKANKFISLAEVEVYGIPAQ